MGPRQTGVQLTATMASAWQHGGWHLKHARSHEVEQLLVHLTTVSLSDAYDTYQWIVNRSRKITFCSSMVYNSIRPLSMDCKRVKEDHLLFLHGLQQHQTLCSFGILAPSSLDKMRDPKTSKYDVALHAQSMSNKGSTFVLGASNGSSRPSVPAWTRIKRSPILSMQLLPFHLANLLFSIVKIGVDLNEKFWSKVDDLESL